jgi:hypothetical protein
MRDLEAIELSVDACLLRARMSAHWAVEIQLRQFMRDLSSASFIAAKGDSSSPVLRKAQLVGTLLAAAERANVDGDAILAADLVRAARDLRAWYRLDDVD